MKTILIPTDFSDNARNAIAYAVLLFEREAYNFCFLHAHLIVPSSDNNKENLQNRLAGLVQSFDSKKTNQDHSFEGVLLMKSPFDAIKETLAKRTVDYVFMGTKGISNLSNIFMGSTTVGVIKNIDSCPIVAVPAGYRFQVPAEIVFANDFVAPPNKEEMEALIAIAQLWDTTLLIAYVHTEWKLTEGQRLNKELFLDCFSSVKHRFIEVAMDYSLTSTLLRLEKKNNNIGMVALCNRKHGFFELLMREHVIRNMVFTTEVPLLVLPSRT
tara:strand:- start:1502 stop:2311 length:810 start_codon:yes stop_codon:yes gene_type:complete